jgi:hypothetical protein
MSEPGPEAQPDDDLLDLAVKQVTEGLSPAEQRAFDALDGELAAGHVRGFERAVAAASLAGLTPLRALPLGLRERLEQQSAAHIAATGRAAPNVAELNAQRRPDPASSGRAPRGAAAGWLAAAACLLVAVFAWFRPPQTAVPPVAEVQVSPPDLVPPPPAPTKAPTPAEERAELLAKAGSLKIVLAGTKDPASAGVSGDVVWDPTTQRGFIRFVGLPANDPSVNQYQIWIFDSDRDKRYPVDGGVFDVAANGGEVLIPIRAALLVHRPAAFAVTVEKPGGVVVSARGHVVALGAAG